MTLSTGDRVGVIEEPATDRVGEIETNGINSIPSDQRHGGPVELFYIYFASNNGPLILLFGAIIVSFGLNVWQAAVVTLIALVSSYALVGLLSIAGKESGTPMLISSRAAFGPRGNIGPTLLSWVNAVGWEAIAVITASYALIALLGLAGLPPTPFLTLVSILIVSGMVMILGVYGHATLVWFQRIATIFFGLLALAMIVFLLQKTDWAKVTAQAPAAWPLVVAAFTVLFAATGVSWFNNAGDYTRYLPRSSSNTAIVVWTATGATSVVWTLTLVGFLLSSRVNFSAAENPILAIGSALPSWMLVPYLVLAVGGNIAGASMTLYSSGLNLLTLGLRWKRYKSVLIDGAGILSGSIYVMVFAANFLGPFQSFLSLLAAGLTTWAAVFLVDMWLRKEYDEAALTDTSRKGRYFYRAGFNPLALVAWLVGLAVGLAFTGSLAVGIFANSNLGYLLGAAVSAGLYAALRRVAQGTQRAAGAAMATQEQPADGK